jgi:hypothetical protein
VNDIAIFAMHEWVSFDDCTMVVSVGTGDACVMPGLTASRVACGSVHVAVRAYLVGVYMCMGV